MGFSKRKVRYRTTSKSQLAYSSTLRFGVRGSKIVRGHCSSSGSGTVFTSRVTLTTMSALHCVDISGCDTALSGQQYYIYWAFRIYLHETRRLLEWSYIRVWSGCGGVEYRRTKQMSIKCGIFIIFVGLRNTSAIQANLRNTLLDQMPHHRDLSTYAARNVVA